MSVPGIGPIISSAMVAAIGTGDAFTKGRDFAAWLGLVPKQMSTGDGTILGKISQAGQSLPARSVRAGGLGRVDQAEDLGALSRRPKKRLHHNVLAIALANKLARIAWSILARGRAFEVRKMDEAANQSA
jgi:transposase